MKNQVYSAIPRLDEIFGESGFLAKLKKHDPSKSRITEIHFTLDLEEIYNFNYSPDSVSVVKTKRKLGCSGGSTIRRNAETGTIDITCSAENINIHELVNANGFYQSWRKTPSFSYGDISQS